MINNIFSSVTPSTSVCWLLGIFSPLPSAWPSETAASPILSGYWICLHAKLFPLCLLTAHLLVCLKTLQFYRIPRSLWLSTYQVLAWQLSGPCQNTRGKPSFLGLSSCQLMGLPPSRHRENPARILRSSTRSQTWCSDTESSRACLSSLRCVGVHGISSADPHPQLLAHDLGTKRKSHASFTA